MRDQQRDRLTVTERCESCRCTDYDFNRAAKGFQDERNQAIRERDEARDESDALSRQLAGAVDALIDIARGHPGATCQAKASAALEAMGVEPPARGQST